MALSPTAKKRATELIKSTARSLGFDHCGISKAQFLEEEAPRLEEWLRRDYHGSMGWMSNNFDKRLDPTLLVPGAKSMVSLLINYNTDAEQSDKTAPKISKYAYGRDYHKVIKKKLRSIFEILEKEIGEVGGRVFVDSAPVMDKVWAERAGLGWIGKHTNLINKQEGSWFFIGEMILDIELEYDNPFKTDHCGSCTRCIDACPTDAITEPYVVDGSKCISYLTIELKEEIPSEYRERMNGWVFGCDICQDVCPWNRFSLNHNTKDFEPSEKLMDMQKDEWLEMTEETFDQLFKGSAVKRTKFQGLQRNLKVFSENNKPSEEEGSD